MCKYIVRPISTLTAVNDTWTHGHMDTWTGWQVNLIMANEITPHLTAEEYMDKGEYENELKQVIGDTKVTVKP